MNIRYYRNNILCLIISLLAWQYSFSQNPIVQTAFTADPAPLVYNGKVYLYTSHDEDNSTWFVMNDWKLYTTEDMVNWTDHGVVATYKVFKWAKGDAWAIQVIERNDKFYLYAPVTSTINNRPAIGVAVADNPYGPFYDVLDEPLIQTEWGDIDPTIFINDDGQAYLYWGNPNCKYVKLNEDLISIKDEVVSVPMKVAAFGKRVGDLTRETLYEEGPWLYKRKNLYYLFWAGGPIPEHLGYSTSENPTGPWRYSGVVMPPGGGSFTNHPGIIDYKGKTYLFYHNSALPGGSGFTRSVCVQEMFFNEDGSVQQMKMEPGIKKSLKTLNPYQKIEAETIAWSENVKAFQNNEVGVFIKAKKDGAFTKVKDVDFGNISPKQFSARVGTTHNGNITLNIHLDSLNGRLLGSIEVPLTGGTDRWALEAINVTGVKGIHDLYFVFKGKIETDILFFDYWRFEK